MKEGWGARVRQLKVTLWTLIVPPSLWAGHFLFSYLWASILCAKTSNFARHPTIFWTGTAVALALILVSGVIAWIQVRTPGTPPPHEHSTDVDRLRFLAKSTLLLAGLSFIGVVFTAIPVLFIADCR